jgi:flagellar assembly protein FliH
MDVVIRAPRMGAQATRLPPAGGAASGAVLRAEAARAEASRQAEAASGGLWSGQATRPHEAGREAPFEAVRERGFGQGRAEGRERGFAEGRAQGLAEGRAQGLAEGRAQGRSEGLERGLADGLEQGRAKGLEEGRTAGRAQGCAEALRHLEARARAARARHEERLEQALASLGRAQQEAERRLESAVGEIAFAAVCRLVGEALPTRAWIAGSVETVCAELRGGAQATVRLHPRDLALIDPRGSGELRLGGRVLRLAGDPSLTPGGCMLDLLPGGGLDATLETRLARLRDALGVQRAEES